MRRINIRIIAYLDKCYCWGRPVDMLIFSVLKLDFFYKNGKINSSTSKMNRVLQITDKYRGNDTIPFQRETESYISTMSRGLLSTKNFSIKFEVNITSHIASNNSVSFSLTTEANISSERPRLVQGTYNSWRLGKEGTPLVDREYKALQW